MGWEGRKRQGCQECMSNHFMGKIPKLYISFPFTSYWQGLCHMAITHCQGGWEMYPLGWEPCALLKHADAWNGRTGSITKRKKGNWEPGFNYQFLHYLSSVFVSRHPHLLYKAKLKYHLLLASLLWSYHISLFHCPPNGISTLPSLKFQNSCTYYGV